MAKPIVLDGLAILAWAATSALLLAQGGPGSAVTGPDPKEIPLPEIKTSLPNMPGVSELPDRPELPDVLTMKSGQKATTPEQWNQRREEMKQILEYYATGLAPPPPDNLKSKELLSLPLSDGKVKYRLLNLTFGPEEKLSLDIGVFTPAGGGPAAVPAVISIGTGSPPGATPLPRQPNGPNQGRGQDVLLLVGPASQPAAGTARGAQGPPAGRGRGPASPADAAQAIAASNPALAHGFAYVTFNYTDCGEDTTLRNADGSWAFRNSRFFPAYPNYDWGLVAAWAWGASRVVDYAQTDPAIDKNKLIITGVSRCGKAALVAGAYDERISMVAPVASSGGGTPAYRFSGADRGGNEGLTEMVRKYPNWFSPHLHEFWGQPDKLPFDEHWFIALAAPRPFIALEGSMDQNVNKVGVKKSFLGAPRVRHAPCLRPPGHQLGHHSHGMVQGDWDGMLSFADKHLLGKPIDRRFDQFPAEALTTAPAASK